jgi:hypothetical protein
MPTAHDSLAVQELVRVCRGMGEHTRTEKFALVAYIQAHIAQAQCQVVFDLLLAKGMTTHEDLERRIAERVRETAKQLEDTQLVLRGVPSKLVLS